MISIQEQIAFVMHDLEMREIVYDNRFIDRGMMTADKAEREIATMKAVLFTLREMADDGDDVGSSAVVA